MTCRVAVAVVLIVMALLVAGEVRAAGQGRPAAVKVEGPKSRAVRARVVAALPRGVTVVEELKFAGALMRAGLPKGQLGFSLTSPKMRPMVLKIVQRAVKAEGLVAGVIGRTRGGSGGLELVLVVVPPQGEPSVDTIVSLAGSQAKQEAALRKALGPAFGGEPAADEPAPPAAGAAAAPTEPTKPTAEEEDESTPSDDAAAEEDDEEQAADDADEGDYEPNRAGSELLSLQLSYQLSGRFFSYDAPEPQPLSLRPYEAFGASGGYVAFEIYPAATTGVPALRDVGLMASYAHVFGWRSHSEDEQLQFSTLWHRLWAGLIYRLRTADPGDLPVVINLSGRVGYSSFKLEPDGAAAELVQNEVPSVEYLLLGGRVDARIPIGAHFALLPGVGAFGPLSSGELYDRFSAPSIFVLNADLAFAVVFGLGFELRGGAEYTGAFASFEPQAGDAYVADGGEDHDLALRLGLAYLY